MAAPETVLKLCETFTAHKEHYKSANYNETELRREFLDPFFKALGWDVDNEQGYADAYKDVIHEDAIKMGGYTKAPDYCFRIGGARKFFVEAKKPSPDIRDDLAPAYQLRRYGWSAKLPLSILSDFEELAVYDTRIRPNKGDKPAKGRTLYFTYDQYAEKWDEIAAIFSREAVLKGSFDKYAETAKGKRGTGAVDETFLAEIERWRDALARNLALRNGELSVRDLNYAVQKIIDRIIFLRICEDRGTEDYGRLQTLQNGNRTYTRLVQLFLQADDRYNSGLFHFDQGEKGRPSTPDTLTPELAIDDAVLKDILKNLYYPDSPFEFSVLPADILGQVYEQFLGKTIRLTASHQAKIEEKPEVRKAGGVYYTPGYIVDYIVKNTLGRLLDGEDPDKPKPISVNKAAEIKVLDPACGSGSFLIVAYQYLLDWHLRQYTADPVTGERDEKKIKKHAGGKNPKIYQGAGDIWRLTTSERKRILLNNIHGVDIDSQAVEVTKLSLLLKVLEGETKQHLQRDFIAERQRILPDLGNNIQCGNSLIGPDFYNNEQMLLLDEETQYRINVFDWNTGFPDIMKRGGFDCVIGNPPYIRIQAMKEWAPIEVEVYKELYRSAAAGNYDIYVVFVEKGLSLLNDAGRIGYILPHKFFNAKYGRPLRGLVSEGHHLEHIVHFGDAQVFSGATTYTCLMFLNKEGVDECLYVQVHDLDGWRREVMAIFEEARKENAALLREAAALYRVRSQKKGSASTIGRIPSRVIEADEWSFVVGKGGRLLERLDRYPVTLGAITRIFVGVQTDADDVFILEQVQKKGGRVLCTSKYTGQDHWFEAAHLKPFLKGSLNIQRYQLRDVTKLLLFPYKTVGGKSVLISSAEYAEQLPLTWDYLQACKERLTARNKGRMGSEWHGYVYKKNHTRMCHSKLLVPSIGKGSCFAPDIEGVYSFVGSGGGGGGYGISLNDDQRISPFYLLGVLNSRLLSHYLRKISTPFRGGYLALNRQYIERLPIRPIDFDNPADVALHDKMVTLVERMLDLNQRRAAEKNPNTLKQLETQITATDNQIDRLVYELYGLSEEKVAIVESASCKATQTKGAGE